MERRKCVFTFTTDLFCTVHWLYSSPAFLSFAPFIHVGFLSLIFILCSSSVSLRIFMYVFLSGLGLLVIVGLHQLLESRKVHVRYSPCRITVKPNTSQSSKFPVRLEHVIEYWRSTLVLLQWERSWLAVFSRLTCIYTTWTYTLMLVWICRFHLLVNFSHSSHFRDKITCFPVIVAALKTRFFLPLMVQIVVRCQLNKWENVCDEEIVLHVRLTRIHAEVKTTWNCHLFCLCTCSHVASLRDDRNVFQTATQKTVKKI